MKRYWGTLLFALPFTLAAVSGGVIRAEAGSKFEGTDGCGVVVKKGCPIEIEREEIRMQISELPASSSDMVCPSVVNTTYEFYNPTEEDEELSLYLPAVDVCAYAGLDPSLLEKMTLQTGDGETVSPTCRFTFKSVFSFDAEAEVDRIEDGRRKDAFFSPDLPATRILYRLTRTASREQGYAQLILKYNPARTHIFFDNRFGGAKTVVEDGLVRLTWETAKTDAEIGVCVFGDAAETVDAFVSTDSEGKKRAEDAAFAKSEEIGESFSAFASQMLEGSKLVIGEEDWYNLFLDLLTSRCDRFGLIYVPTEWISEGRLRTWYEYKLSVPAKKRVTAETSTPLLPTSFGGGPIFRFDYLLSPARRFAAVKNLTIRIETPFYLGYSNLNFGREEGGYRFEREELPIGELSFALASSEEVYASAGKVSGGLSPSMKLAVILLSVLAGGALVAGVATLLIVKLRKRRLSQKH